MHLLKNRTTSRCFTNKIFSLKRKNTTRIGPDYSHFAHNIGTLLMDRRPIYKYQLSQYSHSASGESVVPKICVPLNIPASLFVQSRFPIVFCTELPSLRHIAYLQYTTFARMQFDTPQQVIWSQRYLADTNEFEVGR